MPGALDWLMQQLGSERQDTSTPGDQVVRQDASGNFVPYKPPSGADALQMLYEMTGVPGMQSAQAAWDRGEYLPAIGQEAASVGQLASSVLPVARGLGAAGKFAAPAAREMAASVPDLLADEAGALKLPGGGPIRAYHGSPHDFDRFDSSKIGTGEGAQMFSHGLYFGGREPVAETYLGPNANWKYGNTNAQTIYDRVNSPTLERGLDNEGWGKLNAQRGFWEKVALGRAPRQIIDDARANPDQFGAHELDYINSLDPARFRRTGGHMYEVDLHTDPEKLLDWDRPLSEQSRQVQDVLRSMQNPVTQAWQTNGAWPHATGGNAYGALVGAASPTGMARLNAPAGVSQQLREAGIPGVKYLDQGSRGAGEGTSNYVMYDDKVIEILRKYGLAGLTAGTGAAALGGSAEAAPVDALDRIKRQLGGEQ